MAAPISQRLMLDKENNMFMPMNLEGEGWNDAFMTTPKYACIFICIGVYVAFGIAMHDGGARWFAYVLGYIALTLVAQIFIRRIIFEEKFYHRMYKKLMVNEISTPSTFWNIASAKDTESGAILTYLDGRIAVIIRLERDTITGKEPNFKEIHYEAYSDFYKEIMVKGYGFIQMNIMEQAGRDPRLAELSKLTALSDNKNICMLMEHQVGYIKNITHRTLYESDYIMIHTRDTTRVDAIIGDAIDCTLKILDGAFINYSVLSMGEIVEFIKEEYGVKYFDYNEATLEMLKNQGIEPQLPFSIKGITTEEGQSYEFTKRELGAALKMAGNIASRRVDPSKIDIVAQIIEKDHKAKFSGIEFNDLTKGIKGNKVRPEQSVRQAPLRSRRGQLNSTPSINKSQDSNFYEEEEPASSSLFGSNAEVDFGVDSGDKNQLFRDNNNMEVEEFDDADEIVDF
jgi:hypothetical protein